MQEQWIGSPDSQTPNWSASKNPETDSIHATVVNYARAVDRIARLPNSELECFKEPRNRFDTCHCRDLCKSSGSDRQTPKLQTGVLQRTQKQIRYMPQS